MSKHLNISHSKITIHLNLVAQKPRNRIIISQKFN